MRELERQVGPLKEQSETARKYLIFKDELKKLDINAFLLDVDNNKEQLSDFEGKLAVVEEDGARLRQEFELAKDEYERIEAELEDYNGKLDEVKNEIHEKKLSNQKCEGEINVIEQQIIASKQNSDSITEQIDKAKADIARYKEALDGYYEEKLKLDERLD